MLYAVCLCVLSLQYTQSQAQFNTYVRAGSVLNNYAHIFDILIRLRQAVVHPYLVTLNDARASEHNELFGYRYCTVLVVLVVKSIRQFNLYLFT